MRLREARGEQRGARGEGGHAMLDPRAHLVGDLAFEQGGDPLGLELAADDIDQREALELAVARCALEIFAWRAANSVGA